MAENREKIRQGKQAKKFQAMEFYMPQNYSLEDGAHRRRIMSERHKLLESVRRRRAWNNAEQEDGRETGLYITITKTVKDGGHNEVVQEIILDREMCAEFDLLERSMRAEIELQHKLEKAGIEDSQAELEALDDEQLIAAFIAARDRQRDSTTAGITASQAIH